MPSGRTCTRSAAMLGSDGGIPCTSSCRGPVQHTLGRGAGPGGACRHLRSARVVPRPPRPAPVLDEALRVEPVQDGIGIRGQLAGVHHQLVVLCHVADEVLHAWSLEGAPAPARPRRQRSGPQQWWAAGARPPDGGVPLLAPQTKGLGSRTRRRLTQRSSSPRTRRTAQLRRRRCTLTAPAPALARQAGAGGPAGRRPTCRASNPSGPARRPGRAPAS